MKIEIEVNDIAEFTGLLDALKEKLFFAPNVLFKECSFEKEGEKSAKAEPEKPKVKRGRPAKAKEEIQKIDEDLKVKAEAAKKEAAKPAKKASGKSPGEKSESTAKAATPKKSSKSTSTKKVTDEDKEVLRSSLIKLANIAGNAVPKELMSSFGFKNISSMSDDRKVYDKFLAAVAEKLEENDA